MSQKDDFADEVKQLEAYVTKLENEVIRLEDKVDDSALVGETGPRFGCVHWRADETE